VASAQVKSAILIAGLFARGETTVVEKTPTRDHTEVMLRTMGVDVVREHDCVTVRGGARLEGVSITVPGDFSSAAFFIVAALLVPGSRVHLPFTGVNPRRIGLLRVLQAMGARAAIEGLQADAAEPAGDIVAAHSELEAVEIVDDATVAEIIDEIPVLAVAATQAHGRTTIRGAAELRHKESDRIAALVRNLRALGARIEAFDDGFAVEGPTPLRGAPVSSFGDHRIAMAMAVAGLVADGRTEIDDASVVAVSYPRFFNDLLTLAR
jgi:3-phosphoshikimate 1-carboxyvinyltransferase